MKSWIANFNSKLSRHLMVPLMAIALVGSIVTYDVMKATPARAAAAMASPTTTPLDNDSVGALLSLDQAMETLAARVTPAIVNVTVTSRQRVNMAGGDAGWACEASPIGQAPVSNSARLFGHQGAMRRNSRALSMGWAAA